MLISIDIIMHFIATCFNWYHIDFDFTPWSSLLILKWKTIVFDKKGEKNLSLFLPLCWWLTKRGRRIWVYIMHDLCMRLSSFVSTIDEFCFYWYQEHATFITFIWYLEHVLIIYLFYVIDICIFHIWCQEPCLYAFYTFMHVYALLCLNIHCL